MPWSNFNGMTPYRQHCSFFVFGSGGGGGVGGGGGGGVEVVPLLQRFILSYSKYSGRDYWDAHVSECVTKYLKTYNTHQVHFSLKPSL